MGPRYAEGVERETISLTEAAALVVITFVALITVGARLAAYGLGGIVIGEFACVVLPALVFVRVRRVPAAALGLGRVSAAATIGGLLFGAGAFYLVAVALHAWIEHVWPTPPALREAMRRMVIPAEGARPLAIDLAALALVPAVGEELMFRGVLWRAVRPWLGPTATIVVTAVAFGLYHGSIYRFAPAALGGLLIGVTRARSGSLWPALAFHFANNAGVIVAMHLGYETPPASVAAIAGAAVATVAGVALVARR